MFSRMGIRDKVQEIGRSVSDRTHEVIDGARNRSGVASRTIDVAGKSGKVAYKALTKSTGWVVSKSASKMGADRYREELDTALQEALRVISVQEERIAVLESRLAGGRDE